jgi:hypothetical protein
MEAPLNVVINGVSVVESVVVSGQWFLSFSPVSTGCLADIMIVEPFQG